MDQKLKEIIERTLKTTTPLVQASASHDTKFLNVLLGIYRVSFTTLRDIYYLSLNEETGSSALDLARKIIEYGISVEYMIWKGKDKMAERFQKHMYVEVHQQLEFLKSIGQNFEELKIGVEEIESNYNSLNSKSKKRNNWAGLAVDKMVEELHKTKQLQYFDSSRTGQAYIWGCMLNHVSPFVVHKYMGPEDAKIASDFYLRQAIMLGVLFHLRLTTRYVDEIRILSESNVYPELADEVSKIFNELNNFELKK